eukprot:8058651-Alexandrium_andersonii.AAC.1
MAAKLAAALTRLFVFWSAGRAAGIGNPGNSGGGQPALRRGSIAQQVAKGKPGSLEAGRAPTGPRGLAVEGG